MNTISSRAIIAKLFRDLKPGDATWTVDAVEWIGEALDFIGYGATMVSKSIKLPIASHRVELPADFSEIIAVSVDGARLEATLDTRSFDPDTLTQSYFMVGGNAKALFVSLETGEAIVQYTAFPVDEKGYPMVPDSAYYKQALWWYVLRQMTVSGYQHPIFTWVDCNNEWKKYCNAARNDRNMPTVEQTQQIYRKWVRLIPDNDRWTNYFANDNLTDTDTGMFTDSMGVVLPDPDPVVVSENVLFTQPTLAATANGSLVMNFALLKKPKAMPSVFLGLYQDVGAKTNSLYFSNDNGVTATLTPGIGSKLFVNPTILGCAIDAGEEITIQYTTG